MLKILWANSREDLKFYTHFNEVQKYTEAAKAERIYKKLWRTRSDKEKLFWGQL